jgi:hypothetical protein
LSREKTDGRFGIDCELSMGKIEVINQSPEAGGFRPFASLRVTKTTIKKIRSE